MAPPPGRPDDAPDLGAEPAGFVVTVAPGDRIHFLDWGGPGDDDDGPPVVLIHGLATTAWIWTPVARRLRSHRRAVAMDLRGHGLSDAPSDEGAYDLDVLAEDVVAVVEGAWAADDIAAGVVLAGHGFGAIVAAASALELGPRCAGLVLVDGGWTSVEAETDLDVETFLRGLAEPPEVLASMGAFLADRAAFDPSSWDADQERSVRAGVVETAAGRVVPVTRPHVVEACVRTMYEYEPLAVLGSVGAPITVISAASSGDASPGVRERSLGALDAMRGAAGRPSIRLVRFDHDGHNLMRYRPSEVSRAILEVAADRAPELGAPSS